MPRTSRSSSWTASGSGAPPKVARWAFGKRGFVPVPELGVHEGPEEGKGGAEVGGPVRRHAQRRRLPVEGIEEHQLGAGDE